MFKRILSALLILWILMNASGCYTPPMEENAYQDRPIINKEEEEPTDPKPVPQEPSIKEEEPVPEAPKEENKDEPANTPAPLPYASTATPTAADLVETDDYFLHNSEETLKIMSYNVSRRTPGGRSGGIFALIEKYQPDVVALQEITPAWVEAFHNHYSNYKLTVAYNTAQQTEGLAYLYNTDRLVLSLQEHCWISATPHKESPHRGNYRVYQICHWARFQRFTDGKRFEIYNSKFPDDEKLWERTSYYTNSTIDNIDLTLPAFFCFNTEGIPFDGKDLHDGYEARLTVGSEDERYKATYRECKALPTDFIFHYERDARAITYTVDQSTFDEVTPSDHYPVITQYQLLR